MIIGEKDRAKMRRLEKKCEDLNTELREVVFDNILLTKELAALRVAANQLKAEKGEKNG